MRPTPRVRSCVLAALLLVRFAFAAEPAPKAPEITKLDPAMAANPAAAADITWHDVTTWGVEGREFVDAERLRGPRWR